MGNFFKLSFFILICLFNTDNVKGQTRNSQEVLKAGDAVRIQIWDLLAESGKRSPVTNLSGVYPIDPGGDIFLPFVGLVNVAGRTPLGVENLIKTTYVDFLKQPFIYVRPLIRITLSGRIARPGSYRVDPKSSLWDLFESAGGPGSDADLKNISVIRGGKEVNKNLLRAFEKAFSLQDVGIQSGDQIKVLGEKQFSVQNFLGYVNLAMTIVWVYLQVAESN